MERSRVAVAIREVVVIVVGVLIALGADSAWSRLQDRSLEDEYLQGLASDLDVTLERIAESVAEDSVYLSRTLSAYGVLSGDITDPPRDSLLVWINLNRAEFSPQLTTIRVMVETGGLTLIRSSELRASIVELLARVESSAQWQLQAENFIFDNARDYNRAAVGLVSREGDVDLTAMRRSEAFQAAIVSHVGALHNHRNAIRRLVTPIQRVRAALADMGY